MEPVEIAGIIAAAAGVVTALFVGIGKCVHKQKWSIKLPCGVSVENEDESSGSSEEKKSN